MHMPIYREVEERRGLSDLACPGAWGLETQEEEKSMEKQMVWGHGEERRKSERHHKGGAPGS